MHPLNLERQKHQMETQKNLFEWKTLENFLHMLPEGARYVAAQYHKLCVRPSYRAGFTL